MDDAYTSNEHLTTFILSFWKYLVTYKINITIMYNGIRYY